MKRIQEDITMQFFWDKNPKNGHSALFVSCSHILTRSICCLLFAFFDLATQIFMVAYTSHLSFYLQWWQKISILSSREERCFLYFNHLSKEFLEQMIPHLKALIQGIQNQQKNWARHHPKGGYAPLTEKALLLLKLIQSLSWQKFFQFRIFFQTMG